jgi:hypothetical protein
LEELIVHLKTYGSQTNLLQFHDGFDLQERPFRQCVIVMELISDGNGLQAMIISDNV